VLRVELCPLDELLLAELTRVAVAQAEPDEVMPPVPDEEAGAAGWTARREAAFGAFHRTRSLGAGADQSAFAVIADGSVAGAARLAPVPGESGTLEAGLWLARDQRGRGVGRRVLRRLHETALRRWQRRLLVRTTPQNAALRRLVTEEFGADLRPDEDGGLVARITLRPVTALLMSRPPMSGELPPFDLERADAAPEAPGEAFTGWLTEAVAARVPDVPVACLSTVDAEGLPDARMLLLRDVTADGGDWVFASDATSPKGRQLADRPAAALTLYWAPQGRQIRVRGSVSAASAEESAAEFHSRSPGSRLAALTGRQSAPLPSRTAYRHGLAAARSLLADAPDTVPPGHTVYTLTAWQVEFWQGAADRHHVRLRYDRPGPGTAWTRTLRWP
jgi:pyridoxamine 5'-phosphate oxidase